MHAVCILYKHAVSENSRHLLHIMVHSSAHSNPIVIHVCVDDVKHKVLAMTTNGPAAVASVVATQAISTRKADIRD